MSVRSAGYVSVMPLEGESWIESMDRVDEPMENPPLINLRFASEGYLESMAHSLVAGRLFEERDRNLQGVVLSQSEARALWPNGDDRADGYDTRKAVQHHRRGGRLAQHVLEAASG